MADYDKTIGTNPNPDYKGTMRIRDTGTKVEFWIRAGSDNTNTYNSGYGWTVNGSTGSGSYSYPKGGDWLRLRTFTVQMSQTVTFRLSATGTEGLGGPYTHSVYIDRATARIRVAGVWKNAIPYVRTGGVWKVAQAWIRSSGSWKVGS